MKRQKRTATVLAIGEGEQKLRKERDQKKAMEALQQGIGEVASLNARLHSLLTEERAARQRLSGGMWNDGYEWVVTLDIQKEGFVNLSKPIKVGEHTHRLWRYGKEFTNCQITGKFEGFERNVGIGVEPEYAYVLSHVTNFAKHPDVRASIRLRDVERVVELKLVPRKDKSEQALYSLHGISARPDRDKVA